MKYYTENANLERSMNQILYKTDFVAKSVNLLYCIKSPIDIISSHTLK